MSFNPPKWGIQTAQFCSQSREVEYIKRESWKWSMPVDVLRSRAAQIERRIRRLIENLRLNLRCLKREVKFNRMPDVSLAFWGCTPRFCSIFSLARCSANELHWSLSQGGRAWAAKIWKWCIFMIFLTVFVFSWTSALLSGCWREHFVGEVHQAVCHRPYLYPYLHHYLYLLKGVKGSGICHVLSKLPKFTSLKRGKLTLSTPSEVWNSEGDLKSPALYF